MTTQALSLLSGYSIVILAAAALGVWMQSAIRLTHTRMQVAMSFVAGVTLGVALYHLIPHSLAQIPGDRAVETTVWWMVLGMVGMVLLLRVFPFHQHELAGQEVSRHGRHGGTGPDGNSLSWLGISMGMGLHTVTEGMALGASVRSAALSESTAYQASLGLFLAIVLHKPLDSFSILGLMRIAGIASRKAVAANLGIAMLCPVTAFLACWGLGMMGPAQAGAIGRALAFGAGSLVCISLSDLLPEVHFHGHDRLKLTGSFLAGIALAFMIHYLETTRLEAVIP